MFWPMIQRRSFLRAFGAISALPAMSQESRIKGTKDATPLQPVREFKYASFLAASPNGQMILLSFDRYPMRSFVLGETVAERKPGQPQSPVITVLKFGSWQLLR